MTNKEIETHIEAIKENTDMNIDYKASMVGYLRVAKVQKHTNEEIFKTLGIIKIKYKLTPKQND